MLRSSNLSLVSVFLLALLLLYFKFFRPGREATHGTQTESTLSYDFDNSNLVLAMGKKILILAPHADDEALMCSGIIVHALTNGADVKVCVMEPTQVAPISNNNTVPKRGDSRRVRVRLFVQR